MKAQAILAVSLLLIIFAAGVWDVVVLSRGRPADTVSMALQSWSRAMPVLPLAMGIVLGHLLWPLFTAVPVLPVEDVAKLPTLSQLASGAGPAVSLLVGKLFLLGLVASAAIHAFLWGF